MQCECEHGEYKDTQTRCPNEATEVVLTPMGEYQFCTECAEEIKEFLIYLVHEVPSRPNINLQALANILGIRLRQQPPLTILIIDGEELQENHQN